MCISDVADSADAAPAMLALALSETALSQICILKKQGKFSAGSGSATFTFALWERSLLYR
jgi:hypothetical protein